MASPASPQPIDSAFEQLRADCFSKDKLLEESRQALERSRHEEDRRLREAAVEHRKKAQEERAATKQVLTEMRQVRQKVHGQLRAAQAQAFHSTNGSHQALVRAGKRALTARSHTEQWEAQADVAEKWAENSLQREKEYVSSVKDAAEKRTAAIHGVTGDRVQKSQELLLASKQQEQAVKLHSHKQLETQVQQAARHAQIKVDNSTRAADAAKRQLYQAEAKSAEQKAGLVRDVQRSLEAGMSRVSAAERELEFQEADGKAALWREDICTSQIKRVAGELKHSSQEQFGQRKKELDAMLERVAAYEHFKKTPHQEAQVSMKAKTEEVSHRGQCAALEARQRVGEEMEDIAKRVVVAKEQLVKMRVKCSANVKELTGRFEDAKCVYEAKVREVAEQNEEMLQRLAMIRAEHEDHCNESLQRDSQLQKERQGVIQQIASRSQELSLSRAAFCQQKSAESRRQAEARLEQMKRHVQDVRRRCLERIQLGKEMAQEKVRIAQDRFAENVQAAERRASEALDVRDNAKVAFQAAMLRCCGAAEEAHRRGLAEVAQILMPFDAWRGFSPTGLTPHTAEASTRPMTTSSGVEVWTLKETTSTIFPDRGGTPLEAEAKDSTSEPKDELHMAEA
eukprot:s2326_g8.t1